MRPDVFWTYNPKCILKHMWVKKNIESTKMVLLIDQTFAQKFKLVILYFNL